MDYKIITNISELNLKKDEYYEILPGIFHKKFWNNNSIFINFDIMNIIEDIINKVYNEYSNKDIIDNNYFFYYNVPAIDKLEKYFIKRQNEIANNKNITMYTNDSVYALRNIKKYRNEIIEMLNKLINWVKYNKNIGMTIIRKTSDYKILTVNELSDNNVYFEYKPGKYDEKYKNENSVFIGFAESIILEDLLYCFNNDYERCGYGFLNNHINDYYYNMENIHKLICELENRVKIINNNEKITGYYYNKIYKKRKYYDIINKEIDGYKYEIVKMLEDLIIWLKLNTNEGITVII